MRTRGAARKAADAATLNMANSAASARAEIQPLEAMSDATPSLEESNPVSPLDTTETTKTETTGSKRKRQTQTAPRKKRAAPVKKAWVLPHGMGAALESSETTAAETTTAQSAPTESTSSADQADTPTSANADDVAPTTQPKRRTRAKKNETQTQTGFRVTKTVTSENKLPQTVEQESADDTSRPIKQEDPTSETEQPPATIKSATRPRKIKLSATIKKEDGNGQALVQIKAEEITLAQKNVVTPTQIRKLIIFKNIIFNSNIVAKHIDLSKILIDATQILDPNKRMMIKRGPDNRYGLTPGYSPYPYRRVPTPADCEEVHRILTEAHSETASRLRASRPEVIPDASLKVAGCGEVPCVLDALLRTLISGNTMMALADAAIKNLGEHYGTRTTGTGAGSINWEKVRLSSHQELANVIKVAGNGPSRSKHIKTILDTVYEENLERGNTDDLLSLDHMRNLTKDEAMAKFVTFPGIGIKTAACVSLFCLRLSCFAVDTHVHKFCRWLGWTPVKADPDNCYRHVDAMVPDHLKYGLHNLFIVHGQECFKCRKITKPGTKDWNEAPDCPLEHLLDRSKDESKSEENTKKEKGPKKRGGKKVKGEEDDEGSDVEMGVVERKKPKRATRRKTKVKKEVKDEDETEEANGSEADIEIKKKPRRSTRRKIKVKEEVKDEEETVVEGSDIEMEDVSEQKEIDDGETEDEQVVQQEVENDGDETEEEGGERDEEEDD